MSKLDYDLDPSASLMPMIQALIRPPNEEAQRGAKSKSSHPYYKRRGRGHNHDCCDACEEGGDLICCDRCPASFHLGCHDPPLNERDIPAGIWLCHNCRSTASTAATPVVSTTSVKSDSVDRTSVAEVDSRPATPSTAAAAAATMSELEADVAAATGGVMVAAKIRNLRKRSSSRLSVSSDTSTTDRAAAAAVAAAAKSAAATKPDAKPRDPEKPLTAMEELVRAASILNPRQFELPREMSIFVQFPGSDKIEPSNGKSSSKKCVRATHTTKPHELDSQGLVPLPAKTCFYCRRSCKKAPLLACDYCPLYFHLDCLDPPLPAVPTGLWMCPNHAEQFIDWKLVSSVSATERVKLWSRFSGPIDQDAVKAEFFRKIHMRNPPFRYKVRTAPRERVQVPAMVEYHYRNPPPLLPTLRDVLRCEVVQSRGHSNELLHPDLAAQVEADLHEFQMANVKLEIGGAAKTDDNDDEPMIVDSERVEIKIDDDEEAAKVEPKPTATAETTLDKDGKEETDECCKKDDEVKSSASVCLIDDEIQHLDTALIKTLALQRLQQIIHDNPTVVFQLQQQSVGRAIQEALTRPTPVKLMVMPSELLSRDDVERISRMFASPASSTSSGSPASAQPSPATAAAARATIRNGHIAAGSDTMLEKRIKLEDDHDIHRNGIDELRSDAEKVREITMRIAEPMRESKVRARAILMPVTDILLGKRWFTKQSMNGAVFMRYRNLSIGSGPGNDVPLNTGGDHHCAFVSGKHATIFYDDVTKSFELLNYSEFGTEVNGQLYTCDFTEHPPTPAAGSRLPPHDDPKAFYSSVREIIDRRRGYVRCEPKFDTDAKMAPPPRPICNCIARPDLTHGWEGTAIIGHGTLLRFGCLAYVFSIAEFERLDED